VRKVLLAVALVALPGVTTSTQARRYVTIQFELPSGHALQAFRTPEGDNAAAIELQDTDGAYRTFYVGLAIRDRAAGLVSVTVRETSRRDGAVLDEFELLVGGGFTRTRTSPSFGLAVVEVDD
jgi:hypothetical protein